MESKLPISFSLKILDLSGNHFKVFPTWISDFMPGLEKLYLKRQVALLKKGKMELAARTINIIK